MSEFLEPDLISNGHPDVVPGDEIRLRGSTCKACGRTDFPATEACSACGGLSGSVALSRWARLGAHTAVLHAPPGARIGVPYEVGLACFPEGLSILGLLVPDGVAKIARGMPVETIAVGVEDMLTYGFRAVGRPQ